MILRRPGTWPSSPTHRRCAAVRSCLARLLCWLAVAVAANPVAAQSAIGGQREYNVKAVSLYAFGRYVTWPEAAFAGATTPFVIGVVGANPFGDALAQIAAKKSLHGRTIEVRLIAAPAAALACQIVFIPRSAAPEIEQQLFDQTRGKPVLLVGESPGFTERGGIINFFVSGANVRFELNPERGAMSQLSLNAKLLSLGTKAPNQP